MRFDRVRRSQNVRDGRQGGGGLPIPGGIAGLGGGGLLLLLIVVLLGGDPRALLGGLVGSTGGPGVVVGGPSEHAAPSSAPAQGEDPEFDFVALVMGSTEDVWAKLFQEQLGATYRPPKLHVFRDQVPSACGLQSAAVGPFYCPADQTAYIDLDFYATLRERLGAPGDFAQAYVLAHEVGHHVQQLLGVSEQVQRAKRGLSEAEANELSVRTELQADFYAGVWAHHAEREFAILEAGDVEEGLNAASKIGDDTLQKRARGRVAPDSFTHGSSAQRARWFRRGLESGDLSQGDTFAARDL